MTDIINDQRPATDRSFADELDDPVAHCGPRRTEWFNPNLTFADYGDIGTRREVMVPCTPRYEGLESVTPNLVSSLLVETNRYGRDLHSPILDIDFPARLVPSSTPGHHHLYLDGLVLTWDRYRNLLRSLANYGIIEEGYYRSAVRRHMTCVRPEGVAKT